MIDIAKVIAYTPAQSIFKRSARGRRYWVIFEIRKALTRFARPALAAI